MIFEDRKFADIGKKKKGKESKTFFYLLKKQIFIHLWRSLGNTVKHQYSQGVYRIAEWADIVDAHSLPGEGIITGLKEIGLPLNRGLLLLAEMSSKGNLITEDYTNSTIKMALRNKDFVIGFIASRKFLINNNNDNNDGIQNDFIFMTPGVGLFNKEDGLGQQYRTPREVIFESESDIIIVGRGIYGSGKDVILEAKRYRDAGWDAYLERLK